ncbi:MAG: hypothetical protein MUF49_26450 [Oculatellaceae cyanobacterium Prado106]|jgi:hypothetical protein|nr:hypothetical protein [Oculatellaceae cyanobacterium Prado106]
MPKSSQTADFDTTIEFLQRDLASEDIAIAVYHIEQWEHLLQGTDIFRDLMELKQAMLDGHVTELENMLQDLGADTIDTAHRLRETGSEEMAAKIERIGQLLTEASQHVR